MSPKSIALLAVVLFVSFLTQGCNQTCQQLCLANADYVTGCLEAWDAQWSDFGYDGLMPVAGTNDFEPVAPAEEYRLDCVERYRVALSAGRSTARRLFELGAPRTSTSLPHRWAVTSTSPAALTSIPPSRPGSAHYAPSLSRGS